MRKLQTLIVCLIALTVLAAPSPNTGVLTFTFNFDFVGNPDLQNFWLYYGTSSSNYTSRVSMGTTTNYSQTGFARKTRYFCNVTAFSTNGVESDFTTEQQILTFNKPTAVTAFKVSQ